MTEDPTSEPEPYNGPWDCICGSGDGSECHSLPCAIHNTPDEVWNAPDEAAE